MPHHRCASLGGATDIRSALSEAFSENYRYVLISKFIIFSFKICLTVFLSKIDKRADLREDRWFCILNEALNLLNTASAPKTIASRRLRLQNHDLEFLHYYVSAFYLRKHFLDTSREAARR
jgi:hypothetical protein